jgi:hypothetical protein
MLLFLFSSCCISSLGKRAYGNKWQKNPKSQAKLACVMVKGCTQPQTHCMCLVWMWEAVWGGCEPPLWWNGIISTPQVTQDPKSGVNLACVTVLGCTHMLLRQHDNTSNTLYMSNMDVESSLRWMSASTIIQWHNSTPQVNQNSKIFAYLGGGNGLMSTKG